MPAYMNGFRIMCGSPSQKAFLWLILISWLVSILEKKSFPASSKERLIIGNTEKGEELVCTETQKNLQNRSQDGQLFCALFANSNCGPLKFASRIYTLSSKRPVSTPSTAHVVAVIV